MFSGPFEYSIVKRAQDKSVVKINIHDLRNWASDNYKSIDDKPYGGGPGMIMRVDLIDRAVTEHRTPNTKVILLDAGGEKFTQKKAVQLSKEAHLIFIAGHYEGVDHRVHEHIADEVISIGDYVLSGGEIPTMVVVDSIVRLLPGALGNPESLALESFTEHLSPNTEHPQYTRPENYKGWRVPEVLLSGNHKEIDTWRKNKSTS